MPNADSFKLVSQAVAKGDSESLLAAAELVVAESNLQAEKFNLPELAYAKTTDLEYKVVGSFLLVNLVHPDTQEESYWAWINRAGLVTNLENEFVPPPVNAVSGTRSHGATWRYYPEMPLILREHFGV